jgi:hypothetical protein
MGKVFLDRMQDFSTLHLKEYERYWLKEGTWIPEVIRYLKPHWRDADRHSGRRSCDFD